MKSFWRSPLVVLLVVVVIFMATDIWHIYQAKRAILIEPPNNVLPRDDFSKATMKQIWAYLSQYDVQHLPQNHEVYVVTGGIGSANPTIDSWDSGGNMSFVKRTSPEVSYDIQEVAFNPSTLKTVTSTDSGNGTDKKDTITHKPMIWHMRMTPTGEVYYEHTLYGLTWKEYYFKKGFTYIWIRVSSTKPVSFPTGIMTHLKPLGNPMSKR